MKILVSGSSGLIGSGLTPFLEKDGHEIVKLRRTNDAAELPPLSWNPESGKINLSGTDSFDAVIHLAGETIAQRWTPAARQRIRDSRIKGTALLSEALIRLPQPPKVFLCASATGFYGNRGDELLDERSPPGTDFLAEVCREWENAAKIAAERGTRVIHLRFGIVLTPRGGALGKMLPPFRFGLGGKLGSGAQYWSWIALEDLLGVFRHVLADSGVAGPVNVVSPSPATNAEFTRILGAVLQRPTFFAMPKWAVKLVFAEMGQTALLGSCRVVPSVLERVGFRWRFPDLQTALRSMLAAKS